MRDGWEVVKLAEIANRKTLKNLSEIDLVFTVSAQRGLITQEEYFSKRVASTNLTNYYVVEPGDYVFNKSYSVDAPFGVIAKNTSNSPGLVSPLYIVFGAKSGIIDQDFLGLALTSPIFWKSLEGSLKEGGRGHGALNLRVGDFFEALLPLPPIPEQKRIVDLISSVDSYIEALQQQLESAKRSRNAVLHELLTAGGDGWLETSLDGIAEYINGYPFKPADLGEVGLPVIRIKQLLDPNVPVDRTETDTPDRCLLRDGDIVFSWSGTLAVRIWNRGPAKLNQHLFRVVEKKGVHKGIIPLILDHAIEELEEKSHGTTMKHITKQTLLPHKVLLPPLPEQKRIVEIINTVDDVIAHTELTISKGKVLRSGLLSDLLSGEHEILASYDKVMGAA